MRETLRAIRTTLNSVEVRGKTNLDRLLACINALEELEATIKNEETEDAKNGRQGNI